MHTLLVIALITQSSAALNLNILTDYLFSDYTLTEVFSWFPTI